MQWDPPTLEKVSQEMVDQYLLPLSESEPGLNLLLKSEKHLPNFSIILEVNAPELDK